MRIKDLPISFQSKADLNAAFKRLQAAIDHNNLDLEPYTMGLMLCVKKAQIEQYHGKKMCVECGYSSKNVVVINGISYEAGEGIMDCKIFKIGHYPREVNGCRRYISKKESQKSTTDS